MAQRFFDCSVPKCGRSSARAVGAGCDMCSSHFCGVHMSRDFHKCKIEDLDDAAYNALMGAEIDRLRAQINEKAVCELVSSLNGGKHCIIEYPGEAVGLGALTGCANYHARILFGDGSPSWLMRVPRVSGFAVGFPVSLAEYLIRSEYATLKFLETTAVPAPRAFSFGIPSQGTDHGIGVCFLLMEELPGKPWDGQGDTTKIWKGLAEIYAELEKHPFTKAGSLFVDAPDDLPWVSATASDRFVCLYPYGPFETSTAYYTAWAEQYLMLIADGQLYPQFPIEAYLVYRFLKDNVTQMSDSEDQFFLKHVDDKGDHLMVDEDQNVIGIIDWQMARIVPRREAFAPSLVSADMNALCGGSVSLSTRDSALANALREKRAGMASHFEDEKVRRFFWGLGLEPKWAYALPLAKALLQVFGVEQGWDEWKGEALRRSDDKTGVGEAVDVGFVDSIIRDNLARRAGPVNSPAFRASALHAFDTAALGPALRLRSACLLAVTCMVYIQAGAWRHVFHHQYDIETPGAFLICYLYPTFTRRVPSELIYLLGLELRERPRPTWFKVMRKANLSLSQYLYIYLACGAIIGACAGFMLHGTSSFIFVLLGMDTASEQRKLRSQQYPRSLPTSEFSLVGDDKDRNEDSGSSTSWRRLDGKQHVTEVDPTDLFEKRWKLLRTPEQPRRRRKSLLAQTIHEESSESDF
ncbi:hypothetical protein NUW58_g8497 [Xylaria curta]|uniref:Uncharacterized protein n=1 Tax=Xylaria curta TaxID=42375 RepID=A0ACC1N6Q0_9PEZI|nr:hypothetical protein NUW58_g8497 [Xylaria curta]